MDLCVDWRDVPQILASVFSITLDDRQLDQFKTLYEQLIEANRVMNLTRITAFDDFCMRHLVDSLTLLKALPSGTSSVIDIGSGAGFPALPLAVVLPQAHIVAVESVQKKARFIQQAAQAMGLANVRVAAERSEILAHDPGYRERFDGVVARAVASLNTLAELSLPFVRVGGVFLAMKTGETLQEELSAATRAIRETGGTVAQTMDVSLPGLPNRVIVVIQKTRTTPAAYPRKPGIPAKKPL